MPFQSDFTRLIGRLAFVVVFSTAIAIPLGYFLTTYSTLTGELATEAEINARLITAIVNDNPGMWKFEQLRIEEYLSRRSRKKEPEARRVFDLRNEQVAASADALRLPIITRTAPLLDAGAVVGRIDVSRSLRPILARTVLLFLGALAFAMGGYAILHLAPIRALSKKEIELLRSEEKHRKLIETAVDAIIVFDKATDEILELNHSALTMLGITREHVIGKAHSSIYPPGEAERFRKIVLGCADGGTALHDGLFLLDANGIRTEVEVSASVAEFGGREVVQCRFRDITERRQAEERLVRAERMAALGTLTAGIAHQFNNINTIALGYLQVLGTEPGVSEASKQYIEFVREAIDRSVQITSRLLVLSSAGSASPSPVLVGDVVRATIPFLLPDIEREGVTLQLDLKDSRPVRMDRAHLYYIVRALLDNARQALLGQPRRELRVETADDLEWTRMRVADTGIGIAREKHSSLFTPFFSEKGEHAPRGSPQAGVKGIGLSLAVTQALAAGCGGRIEAQSDAGAGAIFTVWLPAHISQ